MVNWYAIKKEELDKNKISKVENLTSALIHVDNLTSLLEDNEWRTFLYSHLLPIKYELDRQLTNIKQTDKISK
jgi:hypothetical protein